MKIGELNIEDFTNVIYDKLKDKDKNTIQKAIDEIDNFIINIEQANNKFAKKFDIIVDEFKDFQSNEEVKEITQHYRKEFAKERERTIKDIKTLQKTRAKLEELIKES